jgi:hypothetical protein
VRSGCTCIVKLIVLDRAKEIGASALEGCTSLNTLKLGRGLTVIGQKAFSGCVALVGLVIPDRVKEIGDGVFAGCRSLKTLALGGKANALPNCENWELAESVWVSVSACWK